jgi:hypothetical protein
MVVGVNLQPMRRLKIKISNTSLLTVTRSPQWNDKMVYILAANKYFKYQNGRSRIIYIGTTRKGAGRPATSAVNKASQAFGKLHGVKTIEVHIATCRPRRNLQTWKFLEAALLDTFLNRYFQLPKYNKARPKLKEGLFRYTPLVKLITQFDRV